MRGEGNLKGRGTTKLKKGGCSEHDSLEGLGGDGGVGGVCQIKTFGGAVHLLQLICFTQAEHDYSTSATMDGAPGCLEPDSREAQSSAHSTLKYKQQRNHPSLASTQVALVEDWRKRLSTRDKWSRCVSSGGQLNGVGGLYDSTGATTDCFQIAAVG